MERPVGVRVELLVAFVEAIDRQEERFRIADVYRHRQAEPAARLPHRIEPGVVHAHQLAGRSAVAQVESERLEDLHAHGARRLGLADLVGLPGRVAGLARPGPRRLGHRHEAAGERPVEARDRAGQIVARAAGQVDHGVQVDRVHRLHQLARRHARLLGAPPRHVRVKVDDRKPRALDAGLADVQHALRLKLGQREGRRGGGGLPARQRRRRRAAALGQWRDQHARRCRRHPLAPGIGAPLRPLPGPVRHLCYPSSRPRFASLQSRRDVQAGWHRHAFRAVCVGDEVRLVSSRSSAASSEARTRRSCRRRAGVPTAARCDARAGSHGRSPARVRALRASSCRTAPASG